jgi:outer membrane autotransporter protein
MTLRPEIRAAWQHEYGDSSYAMDSGFLGGGQPFLVNGPEIGRDSALLGAGFALQWSPTFSTYLYYDGEVGSTNFDRHAVTGGVRVEF